MFRYEKDMIPVLREHLSELYSTYFFIEEFSSGLGIADLVFTTDEIDFRETLNDFESMYYISTYFNNINSVKNPDDLISNYKLNKNKLANVLRHLSDLDCINFGIDGQIKVLKRYTPCLNNLFAIEAKLKDWKQGFYQALRYKQYSNKSYLAISKEFLHRVDIKLFKDNNVGLISVDSDQIDVIINPAKKNAENTAAFLFLAERFASSIKCCEINVVY